MSTSGQGKRQIFWHLATMIAASADELRIMVLLSLSMKRRPPKSVPPIPPVEQWLPMYKRHNQLMQDLFSFILPECGAMIDVQEASQAWRALLQMPKEQQVPELVQALQQLPPEVLGMIGNMLQPVGEPTDRVTAKLFQAMDKSFTPAPEEMEEMKDMMKLPPLQFAWRVWLPCLLLYREYPPKLFHRARCGDLNALEDLLRLDKSVLADRLIGSIWHKLSHDAREAKLKRVMAAISGNPRKKVTRKSIREWLSGLISQIALSMNTQVTAEEIRRLFCSIAKAKRKDHDWHLPDTPWAMAKAVERNRTFPSLPTKSDKNRA